MRFLGYLRGDLVRRSGPLKTAQNCPTLPHNCPTDRPTGRPVSNTRALLSEKKEMASVANTDGGGGLRLALSKAEAAAALGVSVDFFEDHVMHQLRIVRLGRRRLIPVDELVRWLDHNASRALEA